MADRQVRLDESKYVIHSNPAQMLLFDDSLVLIQNNSSKIYLASFNSGHIYVAVDLLKDKETRKKIKNALIERHLEKINSNNGLLNKDKINIRSITPYDSNRYLIAYDYNFFYQEVNGLDTSYVNTNESFLSLLFISPKKIMLSATYFDMKDDSLIRMPPSGLFVFNDTLYVANLARNKDSIPIFSCYNCRSLEKWYKPNPIYHRTYKDKNSTRYAAKFFTTKFENKNLVSNEYVVQDLNNGGIYLDMKKYIPNIKSIFFFSPLKQDMQEWFVFYSTYDLNSEKQHKQYYAKVNAKTGKCYIEDTKNIVFVSKKDTIISLQKNDSGYVFKKIY